MKWFVCLLRCGLVLVVAASAPRASAQLREVQALVRSISGNATFSVGKGPSVPIKNGMRIPAGSTIQSGSGTVVDLFLGRGGGVLRVKEATVLTLGKLSVSETGAEILSDTQITLSQGEILASVNRLPEGASYEVRTTDGLAGVSGARFMIRASGSIRVLDGNLVFVRNHKPHIIKGPGEFNVQLPQPIRALLPAEIPPLARQFNGMDAPSEVVQRVRPPPPQQSPLSPVFGF